MRISWVQAATGALMIPVVAGMLLLPARLLGPGLGEAPLRLQAAPAPRAIVVRAQVAHHVKTPTRVPAPVVAPTAVTAQLASVVTPAPAPVSHNTVRRAVHRLAAPKQASARQTRHLPLPPDEARPAAPAPAPAPAPVPAPGPGTTPAATPTPAAAPTTPVVTTVVRVLADTAAPAPVGDEDEQGDNGHGNGHANGHDNGNGNGGNGHGHGHGH